MSEISLRPLVAQAYGELVATPYYQDGDMYRYAKHLIVDDANTSISEIRAIIQDNRDEGLYTDVEHDDMSESYQIMTDALDQLDAISIPQPDFEAWVLQRIKSDDMLRYVEILDDLLAQLLLVAYKYGGWQVTENSFEAEGWMDSFYLDGRRTMIIDYRLREDDSESVAKSSDYVLNRKNPFADVSIKNQRFIYASDYERFNALELRTSRKVTKMDKDEDRSFVTLQPGFNIRNSPKVEGGAKSNIRFDDTLTSEITQDDNKTYIYLDAKSLSSE